MDFTEFDKIANNSGQNDGVVARFYDKAVKTENVSDEGMPIFAKRLYVEIRMKDNNSEIFDQPANDKHKNRFAVEFARFKLEQKQVEDGTPLKQFAFLAVDEIATLNAHGIFTVEALVALDEERAGRLDIEKEKQRAVEFLEMNKARPTIETLQAKLAEKEEEIAKLTAQLAEKDKLLPVLIDEPKKGK